MPTNVTLSPSRYVEMLQNLQVPGYQNASGGRVRLSRYICAAEANGGAHKALCLRRKLLELTLGTPDHHIVAGTAGLETFSGQGTRSRMIKAMELVMLHRDALARITEFAEAMRQPDYLQALCDMECFGQDCIGFVGTYLVEAGVDHHFESRTPRGFLNVHDFCPVHSLDEIHPLSVIVKTNAAHVQIIDRIVSRTDDHLVIDLCQSTSSSQAKGPQTNRRVTLHHRPGDVVPFERIRTYLNTYANNLSSAPLWPEYLTWFADHNRNSHRRPPPQPSRAGFNSFLCRHFTERLQAHGYLDGEVFQLGQNGSPANSVGGAVYVATKRGVTLVGQT